MGLVGLVLDFVCVAVAVVEGDWPALAPDPAGLDVALAAPPAGITPALLNIPGSTNFVQAPTKLA